MIEVVFFSVAGKKDTTEITQKLQEWSQASFVPKVYKPSIEYTLQIIEEGGHYPAESYYSMYFQDSGLKYTTKAEILHYMSQVEDYFKRQYLTEEITTCINTSESFEDLQMKVAATVEGVQTAVETFDSFSPVLYSDVIKRPFTEGIKTGIYPIDSLTNGFQPSTVATIGAFTGEGKTTTWISIIYKNAMLGKKCVYMSLEMPPEQIWMMLQARYMYEKGVQVTTTDLLQRKLTGDNLEKVNKLESEYIRQIANNVLIVDSSVLDQGCYTSSRFWTNLYKKFEAKLGGLDLVVHDHIGQYERLFENKGNTIIKLILDATVLYRNGNGVGVVSGFACQANREGKKRADRNGGLYDKSAVSDLNECERASAYLVFLYTPPDRIIVQETVVSMAKHRFGSILSEPTPVAFVPSVCTVGSTVEQISYSDDFSEMAGDSFDFGSSESGGFQAPSFDFD